MIATRVVKRFKGQTVLREVSLQAGPHEVVGLIGANGSGKTTLLRVLLGLVYADSGTVTFKGLPMARALRRYGVRYFGGGSGLPREMTVGAWVSLIGGPRSLTRDGTRIGRLSRGQRQLVGLQAVLERPDAALIVLDEPWEGLDPAGAGWLSDRLSALRTTGATTIVSSHRLADLGEICDTYAFLHDGRVTTISVDTIRSHGNSLTAQLRRMYTTLMGVRRGS
jgi:ABC-2 type transport system ATP-binding protein